MKLMDIDSTPEAEYSAIISDKKSETFLDWLFAVVIYVTKGVKFSTRGDIGTANVACRQYTTDYSDKVYALRYLFEMGNFSDFTKSNDPRKNEQVSLTFALRFKMRELINKAGSVIEHIHSSFVIRASCGGEV
ncbi:hypothetical protein R6Q59_017804 [Mikania micrantha]